MVILISFFNSNFFIALITLLVGGVAIWLYVKQRKDKKSDIASIILMEVRHAEGVIDRIKDDGRLDASSGRTVLLPTNNWIENNYLFIKDFDRDELDLVNNFYNQCTSIDIALAQLSTSQQLEQKGNHIHQALVEIAKESDTKESFEKKKKEFLEIIAPEPYVFMPNAPQQRIITSLNNLERITTSTAGKKLKKIGRIA